MKLETQSNWNCVTDKLLKNSRPISLGRYASYWHTNTPRRTLYSLSYYKFATKMVGPEKRVLDIGCNEGLGSWVVAKECGFCCGVDFDQEAIVTAQSNFTDKNIEFRCADFLKASLGIWDGIVNFDVIEHIYPEHEDGFFKQALMHLSDTGVMVVGTPSEISQQFASKISKEGHVNIYSPQRLEETMRCYFNFVFLFAANDEVVHTGYLPLAHYLIAIGCGPKK